MRRKYVRRTQHPDGWTTETSQPLWVARSRTGLTMAQRVGYGLADAASLTWFVVSTVAIVIGGLLAMLGAFIVKQVVSDWWEDP